MELSKIVDDSIRYPLSDWKKILILGFLSLLSIIIPFLMFIGTFLGVKNLYLTIPLSIVVYILFSFIINGYKFKIIKTSFNGISELPEFSNWIEMLINGVKFSLVLVFYMIPALLFVLIAALSILPLILSNAPINLNTFLSVLTGLFLILIALIYALIVMPISFMAVSHMVYHKGELTAAFRFKEIFKEIARIGWQNLILWYIVTGVIYIIISVIGTIITAIFSILIPGLGSIINSLTISPYLDMFLYRSIALTYISKDIP